MDPELIALFNQAGIQPPQNQNYASMFNFGGNTRGMNTSGAIPLTGGQWGGEQESNGQGGIMQMLFGNPQEGTQGMAMPMVNSLSGLASTYLGMKQYSMAKDAFKESKRQFNLNFDAQRQNYNSSIYDRQQARRISAGSGADNYDTVADYMKKWSI